MEELNQISNQESQIEIKIFSLEWSCNLNEKTSQNLNSFKVYDNFISNFTCIKKTLSSVLCIEDIEFSNSNEDSGLNISLVSDSLRLKCKLFTNWKNNLRTLAEIVREDEEEFIKNNPGKEQPERILIVVQIKDYQNELELKVPWSDRIKRAINQLKEIKNFEEAFRFIDSHAHLYNESYFYFYQIKTIELIVSKSINQMDLDMLNSKEEKDNLISNFRKEIHKIGMEYLRNNLKNFLNLKNFSKHTNCKVFSLCERLNLPEDVKYEDLFFNQNLEDLSENLNFDYNFWKYFEKSLNRPLIINLLEQATKLLEKRYSIENDWLKVFKNITPAQIQTLKYYLKNVASEEVIRKCFNCREENLTFEELNSRTNQACAYMDLLSKANYRMIALSGINPNFCYLQQKKLILEYIESDINMNKNEQYLLIYHSQALILETNVLNEIMQTLERMFDLQSNICPKVKFVFIDYDLHLNDVCDMPGNQLSKMDFFNKNIHFELYKKNLTINQSSEACDLSFKFLVGVPNLKLNQKVKMLDLSKNFLVAIDVYNFTCQNVHLEILNLNKNFITHIEPKTFEKMVNLQSINLNSNFLHRIDNRLFSGCKSLTFLDMSNNRLTSFEMNTFKPLENLKYLKLSSNLITNIENHMFEFLHNLEELNLENNFISQIESNSFDKLFLLRKLYLNHNHLKIVHDGTFSMLAKLEILELSYNKISNITSKIFNHLSQLKQLCLQGNCIAVLERDHFRVLKNLRVLLAESNMISFIADDAFIDLVNLKVLTLFNNQLTNNFNYERVRKGLRKLKHFYFSHERTKLKDLIVYERIKKYLI